MSTATSTVVFNTPTASASVTSLKPISDLLQAMVTAGKLTQTSDTGQVSWGSVLGTQTSTNNYEIFKLNDSMVTSNPLWMKFTYATGTTGNPPKCLIQIGTATDGAGNFTGQFSASYQFRGFVTTADTTPQNIWVSAGSGYLNIWGGFSSTPTTVGYGGFGLSIERLRDSSGAITGDGVTVNCTTTYASGTVAMYGVGQSGIGAATFTCPGNQPLFNGNFSANFNNLTSLFNATNCLWPPVQNTGNWYWQNPMFDGSNFLSLGVQPYAGKLYNPGIAFLLCPPSFPTASVISLSPYSTSHTYLTANNNIPAPIGINAANGPSSSSPMVIVTGWVIPTFLYE